MKFKLEFTFDISDSSLLIDANDGRSEEYTSLEDVPEDTLMDVVYNYLDGVIEGITYDQITVKNYEKVFNSCFYILVWNG